MGARWLAAEPGISAWTVTRAALFNGREETPAAGDAIAQLLATMDVGELMRLDNTSYNLKTGPGGLFSAGEATAIDGDLYYNRARWDAGHPSSYTFANDLAVMDYVGGDPDDGTGTLQSIMLYSGVAYDAARAHICMVAPGGHSNGGHTGGLYFDAGAGCQAMLDGLPNGTGANKREKWQAYADPMPYSAADTTVGEFQHANWDGMSDYLDGVTAGFRWPQPVVNPVLGPANTVGPYSMHTFCGITHHPGTDEVWVTGYTPGPLNHDYSSVPGAAWILDCATKAYAKTTTIPGNDAPALIPPPDGDSSVIFWAYNSSGSKWSSVLTSAPYTATLRSDQGTGDAHATDSAPFWVEDFATSGKWSLLRMSTASGGKFNAHPNVWPLAAATSASLVPTSYSGDTRLFGISSGYWYDPTTKLIYAICDTGAPAYTVKCQTIDMWQGNSTVQSTWVVSEISFSGDTYGAAGSNFETRSGFDTKCVPLTDYGAALIVTYPGQVRLFKYRSV